MKMLIRIAVAAAVLTILAVVPALTQSGQDLFQQALVKEQAAGDLNAAIAIYQRVARDFASDRSLVARALVQMGRCYEKLGEAQAKQARATYERVVREFGDQAEFAAQARARLGTLGRAGGPSGPVARQVLADASGVSGLLSADGGYLRALEGATGDVIQFDVATGQTSRIMNKGGPEAMEAPDYRAVLSRDGTRIAYGAFAKTGDFRLRVRSLDGTGLRTVGSQKYPYSIPLDWTPDGVSILAFCSDPAGRVDLALISTADGSARVLTSVPGSIMNHTAGVSPDGRFVALSFVRDGNPPQADISVMTAEGGNEVVVAGHPADDRLLHWTPNGGGLVFLSDRSGTWDLWMVRIAGGKQQGEPVVLKRAFGSDAEVLGIAPGGSLYYRTSTPLGGLYSGAIDLETGRVVTAPAPVQTRYTSPVALPMWSPDGRSLAYISRPGGVGAGKNILTIRSAATGEERMLSTRLRYLDLISWAPDSRSILARGSTQTEAFPVRIDTETGDHTRLQAPGVRVRLSPDGKTLLSWRPGVILKRNLETGEESEVVKAARLSVTYDLSPDGREVVFQADGAIKVVSLNGGEPRELLRGPAESNYELEWTRDGRHIIALARGTAASEIWRIPVQGGTPLKLDLSVPNMDAFTVHPDNRRFAFNVNEGTRRELWVLENILPAAKAAK